jgi:hypothetical protein
MPYTTVVAGQVITASWGNMVRDQLVTPFADAATRTAQVTVPVEGMLSYLLDRDEIDVYDGAGHEFVAEPGTYVSKTLDENVASSTALQDDDALLAAVKASAVYEVAAMIKYRCSLGEITIGWAGPAAATLDWCSVGAGPGVLANAGDHTINTVGSIGDTAGHGGAVDINTSAFLRITGLLIVGATAGTLNFRWAQRGSHATNTTVKAGSWLSLRRIA